MIFFAVVGVVFVACGSEPPERPLSSRGPTTRLVAHGFDAGGGAVVVRKVIDTKFDDAPCAFVHDQDGVLRCFPVARASASFFEFADVDCTQPAVASSDKPSGFVFSAEHDPCSDFKLTAYRAGDSLVKLYGPSSEGCVELKNRRGYRLVKVSDDTFEKLDEEVVALDDDLALVWIWSGDGFIVRDHILDRGLRCFPVSVDAGAFCLRSTSGFTRFEDADCSSESSLLQSTGGDACGAVTHAFTSPSCGVSGVSEIVETLDSSTIAFGLDGQGQCIEVPFETGPRYRTAPLLDVGAVFPGLRRTSRGTRRIRADYFSASGDEVLDMRRPQLFDTSLNIPCRIQRARGAYRCLPTPGAVLREFYLDSACTSSIILGVSDGSSSSPTVVADRNAPDSVEGDIGALFEVGAEVARDQLYERSPAGGCGLAAQGSVGRECQRYYRIGPALDLSRFHQVREGLLDTASLR